VAAEPRDRSNRAAVALVSLRVASDPALVRILRRRRTTDADLVGRLARRLIAHRISGAYLPALSVTIEELVESTAGRGAGRHPDLAASVAALVACDAVGVLDESAAVGTVLDELGPPSGVGVDALGMERSLRAADDLATILEDRLTRPGHAVQAQPTIVEVLARDVRAGGCDLETALLVLESSLVNAYRPLRDLLLSAMTRLDAVEAHLDVDPRVFVEEVLRLDPPLPTVYRLIEGELPLGDLVLPAGSFVACSLERANRDAQVFADAESFLHDRGNASAHLSFGAGRAQCPAARLARAAAVAVIATLDRSVRRTVDPDRPQRLGDQPR
jgi:hypothetical protein